MKRGGYGIPFAAPAPGTWPVPRKVFFGGLYQHLRPGLNGYSKFLNNSVLPLQLNQVGPPQSRKTPPTGDNCEDHAPNGLPTGPWIGVGDSQYVPSQIAQTFAQQGTVDLGRNGRQRGFKNVQVVRQHPGTPGWTSEEAGAPDTFCSTGSFFQNYNGTPDQTHYRTVTYTGCTFSWKSYNGPDNTYPLNADHSGTLSNSVSVDAYSQKITSSLLSTAVLITYEIDGSTRTWNISGGAGTYVDTTPGYGSSQTYFGGLSTPMDSLAGDWRGASFPSFPETFVYPTATSLDAFPAWFNNVIDTYIIPAGLPYTKAPAVTNQYSYSGTGSYGNSTENGSFTLAFSKSATVFTFNFDYSKWDGGNLQVLHFAGTITLSDAITAADIYADATTLASFWDLTNDVLYPLRSDSVVAIAPLVSRDERETNVSPLQFIPALMVDYRAPLTDANGNAAFSANWTPTWNYTAWQDPYAYGFVFPAGKDQPTAAATSIVQFALTGLVCGMPLPMAFTDSRSLWYQAGFTPASNAVYWNFFDFRANVWKCCQYTDPETDTTSNDWYLWGYGEWTLDAIARTGAQLPPCATQWTNNLCALGRRPGANLTLNDTTVYSTPPDSISGRADALWLQKWVEIDEIWPSQNFFGPGGADRDLPDETAVYCLLTGAGPTFPTISLATDPANISAGDVVAGTDAILGTGNGGLYTVASVDHGAETVTLGALVRALPTGWACDGLAKIRWPDAPCIKGRALITAMLATTDSTGKNPGDSGYTPTTKITVNATVGAYLVTGDSVDLSSTAFTYDGNGNRVSEAMTAVASGQTITRIDDSNFSVVASAASLATVQYVTAHGAPAWYWDDNGRKGAFVVLDWTLDNRTNGEIARLAGVTDCLGNTPPAGGPTANYGYSAFHQTQYEKATGLEYVPCCPVVIAITPNGETWPHGRTVAFPSSFTFDHRYGSLWCAEVETVMAALEWQSPHRPCGLDTSIQWQIDDGHCNMDSDTVNYFAHYPLVEARVVVPTNGGAGQNETAPTPPEGIGYLSPVTNAGGLTIPGVGGFDPGSGNPSSIFTAWGYRQIIEGACGGGCRFSYVDDENLACVVSPSGSTSTGAATITGMGGLS
jgi:YD repeat-containing protein